METEFRSCCCCCCFGLFEDPDGHEGMCREHEIRICIQYAEKKAINTHTPTPIPTKRTQCLKSQRPFSASVISAVSPDGLINMYYTT